MIDVTETDFGNALVTPRQKLRSHFEYTPQPSASLSSADTALPPMLSKLSTPSRSTGILTPASVPRFIASTVVVTRFIVAVTTTGSIVTPAAIFFVPQTTELFVSTVSFGLPVESVLPLPPLSFDLSLYSAFMFSDGSLPGPLIIDGPGGHAIIMFLLACRGGPSFSLSFFVLSQALCNLAVHLGLALTLLSLPPVLISLGLPPHLVPDRLFSSFLVFSPSSLLVFLSHLCRPHLDTRSVGNVPVVCLLSLFLALFPFFTLSALRLEPRDLLLDAGSELSIPPRCLGRFCFPAALLRVLCGDTPDLELSDPPVDLGSDVLLVSHASFFAPHPFLLLFLLSLSFLHYYLSPHLVLEVFCVRETVELALRGPMKR